MLGGLTLGIFLLGCGDDGPTGGGGNGGAGSGGAALGPPPSWDRAVTPPSDADAKAQREACGYKAGSLPAETQGASFPSGDAIPVDHIVILMQENRSFDHYFQMLPQAGQPDVEVAPADFTNPDADGMPVAPFHDTSYCFVDTDHEWKGSHEQYNDGAMDGFVLTNDVHGTAPPHPLPDSMSGRRAMSYYDQTDLPFYYWVANEFAIADHYFCSLLGPTWPNREYLYAASSRGATSNYVATFIDWKGQCSEDSECGGAQGSCYVGSCIDQCTKDEDCGRDAPVGTCNRDKGACSPVGRTIFDYLDQRKIEWKVYSGGTPGWLLTIEAWNKFQAEHQKTLEDYYADAAAGTLPAVAFVDSHIGDERYDQDDEHPPATPQVGQRFVAEIVKALTESPNWSSSAMFLLYDEHGGLWDHVPPPKACHPNDVETFISEGDPVAEFDRYGFRVPMMLISPFAKKHYVSHEVYDHTSVLRFIQARFVLPAITDRDANALAPWDMFDFDAAPHGTTPAIELPPVDQAKLDACKAIWEP